MAEAEIPQQVLTFKYRLLPNKRQHQRLAEILEDQRQLYNAAKQEREDCYRKTGKSLSYIDQCKSLSELRKDSEYSAVALNIQRATIRRLDLAFQGFFRRLKKGAKAGFPRFKGNGWWNSFGFAEFWGITINNKRIRFKGMLGHLRVHMHRRLPEGKILSCQFRRDVNGWYVCLQVRIIAELLSPTGCQVGIDMGLSSFAVLSTGEHIPNPRTVKRHERELRRRQRRMSRCKKGSNGRHKARECVARLHLKIRNSRATYLHQVSAKLVRENDVIAIEKLKVKGMAAGILAKSVNDAGWSILKEMLVYKAAKAGRQVIEVNARNTTQACSGCGVIVPKTLADRWHECPECGLSLDRDHNAAINILGRSGSRGAQDKAIAYVCA